MGHFAESPGLQLGYAESGAQSIDSAKTHFSNHFSSSRPPLPASLSQVHCEVTKSVQSTASCGRVLGKASLPETELAEAMGMGADEGQEARRVLIPCKARSLSPVSSVVLYWPTVSPLHLEEDVGPTGLTWGIVCTMGGKESREVRSGTEA
ncbi:hypothetical protein P7K49_019083 [Saguinus oedipus]|uniref:Uncharacterized protein n=1 Tax=Saguinus oedipus TaxID=9490 RepID=A0ABQ9UWF7_SAGOE|nr:hypothetical protein P7K49_019083 [Saguinus oedipus]